ncbi:MAG: gliding motility protein GldL [Dysgonamonadaceae bacterium]|jgi:gliding motility-associated protein GldL|nr:gliding motility protein GldL [Dysgonamonadaceae bacterium]
MGFKRKYSNAIEKFLSGDKGKVFFHVTYSIGASIVLVGVLAKLMHWPHGNLLICIGFIVEALIFAISAFDTPSKDYKWEEVFPILDSKDPEDRPSFNGSGGGSGGSIVIGGSGSEMDADTNTVHAASQGGGIIGGVSGPVVIGGSFAGGGYTGGGFAGGGYTGEGFAGGEAPADGEEVEIPLTSGQVKKSFGIPNNVEISEEDTNALTASIKKLSEASEQLAKMAEMTDATQQYLDQISKMSESMQRFGEVTGNLTEVSDILLNAYKNITDNSGEISENSKGYVAQMDVLNRNIATLNQMFEMQIHSITSQMDAVNRINAGLSRIKEMYEGSVVDSSVFRSETEKMTQQIAALNNIYTRLLNAMTMNMNIQTAYNPGYQPNPPYNPGYNPGYNYPPNTGNYRPNPNNEGNERINHDIPG